MNKYQEAALLLNQLESYGCPALYSGASAGTIGNYAHKLLDASSFPRNRKFWRKAINVGVDSQILPAAAGVSNQKIVRLILDREKNYADSLKNEREALHGLINDLQGGFCLTGSVLIESHFYNAVSAEDRLIIDKKMSEHVYKMRRRLTSELIDELKKGLPKQPLFC